jgi:hypothetical protein
MVSYFLSVDFYSTICSFLWHPNNIISQMSRNNIYIHIPPLSSDMNLHCDQCGAKSQENTRIWRHSVCHSTAVCNETEISCETLGSRSCKINLVRCNRSTSYAHMPLRIWSTLLANYGPPSQVVHSYTCSDFEASRPWESKL